MTGESVLSRIVTELEDKSTAGLVPDYWEIGISVLKNFFQTGRVQRIDPGAFMLAGIPVKIVENEPDAFRLITKTNKQC